MSGAGSARDEKILLVRDGVKTIALALLIAGAIHAFLYQPFYIPSGSMVPTLLIDDYVLVNKFAYGYSRFSLPFAPALFSGRVPALMPKRGDVVVLAPTQGAGNADLIKRVIGLPGDTVQVTDGQLFIDGAPASRLDEGRFVDDSDGFPVPVERFTESLPGGKTHPILKLTDDGFMNNTPPYIVPAGDLFMMGDNRDNSLDSRVLDDLGYVPVQNIVGRASMIFFSIDLRKPWYAFWDWPTEIRWDRLMRPVS